MNDNIKKIMIPFILALFFDLGSYYLGLCENFANGVAPSLGFIVISGLLFGPFGALGTSLGLLITDIVRGYSLLLLPRNIIVFAVSYLAYKLWYSTFKSRPVATKPRLNNTSNVILFLAIIVICAIVYVLLTCKIIYLVYPEILTSNTLVEIQHLVNFINFSFIFGIIGIWLSKRIDFIHVPKTSAEKNNGFYKAVGILLAASLIILEIIEYWIYSNPTLMIIEVILITVLLFIYLTKPVTAKIVDITINSIPESIMNFFFSTTLIFAIIGTVIAFSPSIIPVIEMFTPMKYGNIDEAVMMVADIIIIIFFIPALAVLRYIEQKVINPITSFSKIEKFLKKGAKIESKDLTDTYSEYLDENNEIGILARSYTSLIEFGNDYIENIRENEIQNERNRTELHIAENIQKSNWPTKRLEQEDYTIYGVSKPAREVGGDFYDYYKLDEDNVALMIGDASGKGVPAALLVTITQSAIKQLLKSETDPSKVLYSLNNQLCENNSENMFVTLWLGIYNNKTKIMTFSSAGHPAPLVFQDDKFEALDIKKCMMLGIMEDYEYAREEVIIDKAIMVYTDGITDARNPDKDFYGEERLLDYLNTHQCESKLIKNLLGDIDNFRDTSNQYDDITVVLLEIHD